MENHSPKPDASSGVTRSWATASAEIAVGETTVGDSAAGPEALDERLSHRFIELDPAGYFLISVDHQAGELIAEHYGNSIDERGLATDPETGEVLSCRGGEPRSPLGVYRGRTAKELGIQLTEAADPVPLSRLDHALYLGRELQKAELCLRKEIPYIQD
jgi:dihydropteroate synthase